MPHRPYILDFFLQGTGHVVHRPAVQHIASTVIGTQRVTRCLKTVPAPCRMRPIAASRHVRFSALCVLVGQGGLPPPPCHVQGMQFPWGVHKNSKAFSSGHFAKKRRRRRRCCTSHHSNNTILEEKKNAAFAQTSSVCGIPPPFSPLPPCRDVM